MVYIIMGVSGVGKTEIGVLLADKLDLPFYDGDDFHPPENVEKMRSGRPLTDEDRKPWLTILAMNINKWTHSGGAVLACSALKQTYRDQLVAMTNRVRFIHLTAPEERIEERLSRRKGHYMPGSLLQSQLNALEPPNSAITVENHNDPEKVVEEIIGHLKEPK